MKKVLILVQACDDPPYFDMQQAQLDTWDSVDVPGVETWYYYGNNNHNGEFVVNEEKKKLYCPCSEAYDMMHFRHKLAVDYLWSRDWDFIFRTNASSYVHKQKLLDYAQTLPLEGCFVSKGDFVMSGCGFFMSRDITKIANDQIDDYPTPSEDMYIASMLNRKGIDLIAGGDRVDFNHYSDLPERECYHYRCKSDTLDRTKDIKAFNKLFKQFHG